MTKNKSAMKPSSWNLKGMGGVYVLVIMGLVSGLSYLLTGGLTPNIERNPENPKVVQIEDPITPVARQNLQMQNIGIKLTSTPTPTIPGITPTPIQTTQACVEKTAINILVDNSYSMLNSNKMGNLKISLEKFVNYLAGVDPDFYIGIDVFGAYGASTKLNMMKYSSNTTLVTNTIKNLSVGSTGGTYMRSGFEVANKKIVSEKSKPALAGYQFVSIVFSDGVPEVSGHSGGQCLASATDAAGNYKCFAKAQDPRTDLTIQMKNITDKVYSVVVYSSNTSSNDYKLLSVLKNLMQDIADDPDSTYYYDAVENDPGKLTTIFQSIPQGICK